MYLIIHYDTIVRLSRFFIFSHRASNSQHLTIPTYSKYHVGHDFRETTRYTVLFSMFNTRMVANVRTCICITKYLTKHCTIFRLCHLFHCKYLYYFHRRCHSFQDFLHQSVYPFNVSFAFYQHRDVFSPFLQQSFCFHQSLKDLALVK